MGSSDIYDLIGTVFLLGMVCLVVIGPMLLLLWWRGKQALDAMRKLRDKIDGTQHWP